MPYEISLVRPELGMTALQTIEWRNAQFDIDLFDVNTTPSPLHLSDGQAAAWERVCDQVSRMVASTEREEFPSYVGVTSLDPRVRLEFFGDTGSVAVPFWYHGDEANAALTIAYAVGRVMEAETGLVGVDAQTGTGLQLEHVPDAVHVYTGTRSAAVRSIDGTQP